MPRPWDGPASAWQGKLTVATVAKRLNLSPQTVRVYVKRGLLHTETVHGVNIFNEAEVAALRAKQLRMGKNRERWTDGEIAARAFEIFDEGRGVKDVVRELRISYDYADTLYDRWQTPDDQIRERRQSEKIALLKAAVTLEEARRRSRLFRDTMRAAQGLSKTMELVLPDIVANAPIDAAEDASESDGPAPDPESTETADRVTAALRQLQKLRKKREE